ncbi:leucine-rich repeat-containing protein 42 [Pelodytes ibericus]
MSCCPEESEYAGPVYVREHGKLFLSGSQISSGRPRPTPLFSRGFSVELCVKREDTCRHKEKSFFFTYTEQGSLRYSAKPLFLLTLDLIADNVQHVDSLLGFPEQVAEKLFTAAEVRQKFSAPISGLKALQKFTEAYGDLILSSLCLRGKYLLVSEKLEEIKSFQGLRCLDLSCCKLGDEHELIGHFTTEALNSLTELYLKDNCLSDTGIRRLTAPARVLYRGLGSLTVLDLSDNRGITDLGVSFLYVFKTLNFLDVSETSIQNATVKRIEAKTGLKHSKEPLTQFQHMACRTQGWAEQILDQWEQCVQSAIKPKPTVKSRAAAQQFYGQEKRPHHPSLENYASQIPSTGPHQRLQFYRPGKQDNTIHTGPASTKRTHEAATPSFSDPPSSKRPRLPLTDADQELLNIYSG